MSKKIENLSCLERGQLHCYRSSKKFPDFCLAETTDGKQILDPVHLKTL
ncbi:MAG: hypothetical protein H6R17_3393 [Proteobacteria bacterium]|nr:hypothetical protein [Pseudomonadota bacterium]